MADTLDLRTLLAPIEGGQILLPGSMVAEVVAWADLDEYPNGPEWLLGELHWNGWQIPVVNFAHLAGVSADNAVSASNRILVAKTLAESGRTQHIGLVITGMPRFKDLSAANLEETGSDTADGVFSHVTVDQQPAVIPDMDALTESIESAVY